MCGAIITGVLTAELIHCSKCDPIPLLHCPEQFLSKSDSDRIMTNVSATTSSVLSNLNFS
jgi:hypothetical protein